MVEILSINPFSILAETVSPLAMQYFIIAMILLIAVGTIIQMIHHKNLTYFFNNAKKAKLSATKELGVGEKASIIAKTTVVDIGKKTCTCSWNVWNNFILVIICSFSFLLHWCRQIKF